MSAIEKMHRTDVFELTFYGPAAEADKAKKIMAEMGFIEVQDSIPASAVLPERAPGTLLAGLRYREGLTQEKLAELSGIPRRHISEMEIDRRTIGKQRAKRLAEVLNADYRMLL